MIPAPFKDKEFNVSLLILTFLEKKETWSEFCFVIYLCYFCLVMWPILFFSSVFLNILKCIWIGSYFFWSISYAGVGLWVIIDWLAHHLAWGALRLRGYKIIISISKIIIVVPRGGEPFSQSFLFLQVEFLSVPPKIEEKSTEKGYH